MRKLTSNGVTRQQIQSQRNFKHFKERETYFKAQ